MLNSSAIEVMLFWSKWLEKLHIYKSIAETKYDENVRKIKSSVLT